MKIAGKYVSRGPVLYDERVILRIPVSLSRSRRALCFLFCVMAFVSAVIDSEIVRRLKIVH